MSHLRRAAAIFAMAGFAAMFAAFIIQIFTRYVLNEPTAWTTEATLICYIWVVFWTAAFLVGDREHITFDMAVLAAPPRLQRWFALVSAALIAVAFALSLPATVDWVTFMRIEKSPVLRIRFDWLYSIFVLFSLAVIVRALLRLRRLASSRWREELALIAPAEVAPVAGSDAGPGEGSCPARPSDGSPE